jgi:hypothetical protein
MCTDAENRIADILLKTYLRIPQRTQFATVIIPASALLEGLPLGIGKCVGVELQLNSYVLNTTTAAQVAVNLFNIYYGDSGSQAFELAIGNNVVATGSPSPQSNSGMIYCKDLSEIYVRGNGVATGVQVKIYLGDEDVIDFNPDLNAVFG